MGIFINVIRNDEQTIDVQRYDKVDVYGGKGTVNKNDEGFLEIVAPVAKIGVMSYLQKDGSIRKELVNADTLFNEDSMNTLKLKPVTNQHPQERLLDSRTVSKRKVGTTGETVKRDGDHLMSKFVVMDKEAIDDIEINKRKQLSPGYRCQLLLKPGEFNGEHYDAIQLNRKYNHLALCDRARGGNDIRINIDHCDGSEDTNDLYINNLQKGDSSMLSKYTINGISYEAAQEVINYCNDQADTIGTHENKIATLEASLKEANKRADEAEAKRDSLKEEVEELKKIDHTDSISQGVKERLSLEKVANIVLDSDTKIDEMDNASLRLAIIKKKSDINLDGKSEDYIAARFDAIVEKIDFKDSAMINNRKKINNRQDNQDTTDLGKVKTDSEENLTNAYQNVKDYS